MKYQFFIIRISRCHGKVSAGRVKEILIHNLPQVLAVKEVRAWYNLKPGVKK